MSKRRREDDGALSLDSFLDIVTNVVGALILIAVVTVIGAGDISVSTGASALVPTVPTAERLVFHCADNQIFFVDEKANAERIRTSLAERFDDATPLPDWIIAHLLETDVGDPSYRVQAETTDVGGVTWVYHRRAGVRGDTEAQFDVGTSDFEAKLDEIVGDTYVYFVVHADSFEIFRRARDLLRERGVPMGWHPVEGYSPLRIGASGDLGKRIQ